METHRQESLRAPVPGTKPNPPVTPRPHDQCDPEGRLETEEGSIRRSDREATGIVPPPLHKEAWHQMKVLYKSAVDCALLPARVTCKRITADRANLYCQVQPLGENIPIYVEPFQVEDSVPTEDEI